MSQKNGSEVFNQKLFGFPLEFYTQIFFHLFFYSTQEGGYPSQQKGIFC